MEMKFKCEAKELVEALKLTKKWLPKPKLPISRYCRIEAKDDHILVSVSKFLLDTSDATIEVKIPADVEIDGTGFIEHKSLFDFVKYETSKVAIENNEITTMQGNESTLSIPTINDTYPLLSHNQTDIELPELFISRLKLANCFAATEDTRPVLASIHIGIENQNMRMASADGFRLCAVDLGQISGKDLPATTWSAGKGLNIPLEACLFIAQNMKMPMQMGVDDIVSPKLITFTSGNIRLTVELTGGAFPMYKSLIPDKGNTVWSFTCSTPILESRVKQSGSLAESPILRMIVENKGELKLQRLTQYAGSGFNSNGKYECNIPATTVIMDGKESRIALNSDYLLPITKYFSEIKLEATTPSSPMMITGDLDGVICVIMPMFMQW
jgi:DNA polymerase III sliding clamp (beta) subunit (PCNA family)